VTPAADVLLYVYHTSAAGVYPKRGTETGNGRRHGYLRGWLRTNGRGEYRVETIRPGSYPSGTEPAHVHFTLQPLGEAETYIDDVLFDGDPRLTGEYLARLRKRGGSGIVQAAAVPGRGLAARRDIVLPSGPPEP